MADDILAVARSVISRNAAGLATADSRQAVEDLAPKIAAEIKSEFDPKKDSFSYRAVIVILGIVVVVVALTYAAYTLIPIPQGDTQRDLPDALIALGSAAVGALAGLLAPAPRS